MLPPEIRFAVAVALLMVAMFPVAGFTAEQDVPDFAMVQKAAEQGGAEAQSNLGFMYVKGQGVPKDEAKAVHWWTKAAEQGDAVAQNNLGVMYAKGQGVPKDEAKAAQLFQKAVVVLQKEAEHGDARAQYNLGNGYYNGVGVPKDDAKAVHWWAKAAEQGDAEVLKHLGIMAKQGNESAKKALERLK